nr:ribonuclease H-like domain-containing protein [Tanacetum cinerariifolium]
MEYWITNNDINIWKVIQNGNNLKRTGRDHDGRVIILPPTTADEHIDVQRESKARTTLLQSIPDDHVADFHYMDDARDIWNAVKARFGRNAVSKKMRKSILKQEFLEFRIGGLELLSFDDLYYKLKTLDVDVKGYTTFPQANLQVQAILHLFGNVIKDVLQSFVDDTEPEQQLAYEDFEQIEKLDLEEMDLKWQMAMLSEEDSKALITVDMLVDWTDHDGESDGVIASKEFGMIAGCDTEDAVKEGDAKIYHLITGADTEEACTAGRPLNRFAKADSKKAVPLPLTRDYTYLSDHIDLDESQMSYEPKPNDSTFGASTSSVSTYENEAEIESNFVPQAILLRTRKVNIPPARPQLVPTGKPKVFALVPTGRHNRPFLVPTDRGYSPSENPFPYAKDEGVFDSGCSKSMTGNKEILDNFREIKGRKVTFRGGEGKQHKASYKAINDVSSISEPLQLLHMDLFGPTSIRSIDHKYYCLVITDDYSRTSQQIEVAEMKNKTFIEAARTMLADSKIPTMFWTEAVRTACYVLNRVLADEGYIIGYCACNKAYKVYNLPNKKVEETMNLRFHEEKPNVQGLGHEWYFNLDYLTDTLGYKHVQANQST